MADFDLGLCVFVLNESKFLKYSIESFLASPCVKCISIVEGAVRGILGATDNGLSSDRTAEIARELARDERVFFEQAGWVDNKAVLQNMGFARITKVLGSGAIHGLAGADELYHARDLSRVQAHFIANPNLKMLSPTFHHFWWRPDLVATHGNWDTKMHRFYRSPGKRMVFAHHAAPPADCALGGKIAVEDVECFHYIGMCDKPKVDAKLALYRKRDGHRLNVVDTWTNWQWGQPTQWTHGGGTAERFEGEHPPVIAGDVWELTPRDANGNKLPLPWVPWDKVKPFVKRRIGVFFDDGIPNNDMVRGLLRSLVRQGHKVTAYTLDNLPEARDIGLDDVRDFDARSLRGNELVIVFPYAFAFAPSGARHVAILYREPKPGVMLDGYTVFQVPGLDAGYDLLPLPEDFVEACLGDLPPAQAQSPVCIMPEKGPIITMKEGKYKRRGPVIYAPHTQIEERAPLRISSAPRRADRYDGEESVQIKNAGDEPWTPYRHEVVARWWDGLGNAPIADSPIHVRPLPRVIKPGEMLEITVPVPDYRGIIDAGFLHFVVDIRVDRRYMLNVGPRIKKFLK